MGRDLCSVVACGKRAEDGFQLHHIPNDPILADMYKRFLQIANENYIGWKPTVRMCVCDDHFHSENFVMTGKERKLKRGKYPTLAAGIDLSAKMVGVDKQMQLRTSSQTFACGLVLEPSHINILANQFQADKPTVKSKAAFTIQTIKPNSNCNSIGIGSFQEQIFMLKEENEQLKKERALDQIQYGKERIENERLKTQILHLQAKFQLIQKEIHVHRQNRRRIEKRQQERKRKREDEEAIETELKRRVLKISVATQTECQQLSQVEALFHNLMERKINNKNFPYTKLLREFSFVLHYFSPAAYKHVRRNFDNLLPHPCQFVRWTDFFKASPGTKLQELLRVSIIQIYNQPKPFSNYLGLIPVSLRHIAETNKICKKLYSLSFDEMAIRVQILHKDNKIVGFVDGGGLTSFKNTAEHAKNAFFVVATEINGNKSIPIAYILTRGLQASQITDVLAKCLHTMHNAGGKVISITFDGLPANFKAMESMGANFELGTERFKTFIEHPSTNERIYLMPDSSHMFKLVRNNFKACKILKNGKDEVINWGFIARLQEIQDFEGVRAGNKLTKAHVQFERKKMNTRLMAHTLSHSSSTGITTCRVLNIDGFQGSEATCEFLDTCDKLFDMFNSKSRGIGLKTPMKNSNSAIWAPFLKKAKEYFLTLQCKPKGKDQYTPVYKTTKGTFVKGIVTSITSLEMIMNDMAEKKINLEYLPTYRQSQDPIEILFGKFRARLGFNNNPNSVQLEHALKATLCYSIHACTTGNCIELEELSNRINPMKNLTAWDKECEEDEAVDEGKEVDDATFALLQDLPSFDNLSLFVENVVVYIAGFVGKRLQKSLKCSQCKSLLVPENLDNLKLRSDYVLLNTKNRGGLFCPSADLIKVCMIAEKKIRINLAMGLSKVSGTRIEHAVVQTCLDSVFENSYSEHEVSDLSKYEKMIGHRTTLVREITKYYITIRLHYAAKLKSSELVAEKKRSFYNKLGHFQGY